MPIIEVNHLTKEYQLGQLTSLKETALNTIKRMTFQPIHHRERFKALDDINFTVEEGEVLGIIGHNGAGKSTLLKHLANISKPTKGNVIVRGSVAPLIEVGAGVNPELTGKENIFLNGAILGVPKKIILQKLDEIIEFSELKQFIDTPVKRYSSGMKVKLGFSIATSMDAEILIVDEVLAVGDLAFQRKCFDRMEDMIKRRDRTVLIVSHNIRQIERMCSRACLLDHGKIIADGSPKDICELYYEQSNIKISQQASVAHQGGRNLRMSGEVSLISIKLLNKDLIETDEVHTGEATTIRCIFKSEKTFDQPEIVFGIHTTDFVYIASMGTAHIKNIPNIESGETIIDCHIHELPLVHGVYGIRVGIIDKYRREIFYGESLKLFRVKPNDIPASKLAAFGLIHIPVDWHLNNTTCS